MSIIVKSTDISYIHETSNRMYLHVESNDWAEVARSIATSRIHFRTKVSPDLHLTYSKNGGNLRLVLK